jgi:ligand-binding sensor domain-containing protein
MPLWRLLGVAWLLVASEAAAEGIPVRESGAREEARWQVAERFGVGANVTVRALTHERGAEILWVGTSVGVIAVEPGALAPRHVFTRRDGLATEYVFSVAVDSQGYKWFGTKGGGASRYKEGEWQVYFPLHGLTDYWVQAFASDGNGDLWIGTGAGASKYEIRTGRFTTYRNELHNQWVYALAVDAGGRVWFGTEGGVSLLEGERWRSWGHGEGIGAANVDDPSHSIQSGLGRSSYSPGYVFAIVAARDGTVWAGTWGGGVSVFDGREWTSYTRREGLAGNIVYSIIQASDGALWFGTDNGVTRFDGRHWDSLGGDEGLFGRHVYALAEGADGSIWAGSRNGVVRIVRGQAKE